MSLATQIAGAIERAQFADELNALARDLWAAHNGGEGSLTDAAAQELAERIEARRPKTNYKAECSTFKKISAPAAQRSPDKQASIERRRRLARASPVPPEYWHRFTQAQHAVMTVVCGDIQQHGYCNWWLAKIAAVAGTCKTVVRAAIDIASELGLLWNHERRRAGQKSGTNIVRAWRTFGHWLRSIATKRAKRGGSRKTDSTTDKIRKNGAGRAGESSGDGFVGARWWCGSA
jgi:hypothetical protein